jgi:hypothetical protein
MKIPFSQIEEALARDDDTGFCLDCGNEQSGCEPDARNYECDDCGKRMVFGAAEILMMNEVDLDK